MTLEELLKKYPRIAITGAPGTGKTSLTRAITDRPVVHTDDWMEWPWSEVPELVAAACAEAGESFIVEGVQVPRTLRKGLEVDAVVFLSIAKEEQTPAQLAMGKSVHTVLAEWHDAHPDIPIVTEEQLSFPTLDRADVPTHTRRYARSALTLDGSSLQRTPQGGLRIPAVFSKAGVYRYQRGAQQLREYRPASELKKPKAIASLKGCPVVILHPDDSQGGAVDTENARQLTVGHVEDPVFNEETQALEGFVVINDADTIARIETGELADISCGYDNRREEVPGFAPNGDPHDLIQVDYEFNHTALGPPGWGRQGQDVGLTLDSDDNEVALPPINEGTEEMKVTQKGTAKTKTSDSEEAEGTPAVKPEGTGTEDEGEGAAPAALTSEDVAGVRELVKMLPALTELLNSGHTEDETQPPAPKTETEDEGEGEKKPEPKTLDAADVVRMADESAEVRTEARTVLGADYSSRGKSTRAVRLDVIRSQDSKFDDKGLSDESVGAAYGVSLIGALTSIKNAEALGQTRRVKPLTKDSKESKPLGHQSYDAWQAKS